MNKQGFSLIEVLIAALVLGGISLSIIGLFAQGARGIQVGKSVTDASAAGDHIMSQLNTMGKRRAYEIIGASDSDTGEQIWTYEAGDGIEDSSGNILSGAPTGYSNLGSGDQQVIKSIGEHIDKLKEGKLTYSVQPLADVAKAEGVFGNPGTDLPDGPELGEAIGLKVSITIEWKEKHRDLQVDFETVK